VSTSDAELLARSAAGNREAFDAFVLRHRVGLGIYLRSLSRDASTEDALQEAFLSAWRHAGSFRGEGSARAWVLAIARNALFKKLKPAVGPTPEDLVPLDVLGRAAGWGAEPSEDPREMLLDQDAVQRALARLGETDREALLLKDVEGLRNDEAAALLGMELAAFKSRLHRARLRFIAALGGTHHGR
jgi:RNA polymerase sigma-70 factor, ECF subfamily